MVILLFLLFGGCYWPTYLYLYVYMYLYMCNLNTYLPMDEKKAREIKMCGGYYGYVTMYACMWKELMNCIDLIRMWWLSVCLFAQILGHTSMIIDVFVFRPISRCKYILTSDLKLTLHRCFFNCIYYCTLQVCVAVSCFLSAHYIPIISRWKI